MFETTRKRNWIDTRSTFTLTRERRYIASIIYARKYYATVEINL